MQRQSELRTAAGDRRRPNRDGAVAERLPAAVVGSQAPSPQAPEPDALAPVLARAVAKRAPARPPSNAGSPLLARMNLAQTKWVPDVEDIGTRTLVSDGRKVKLYYKEGPEQPSKASALAKAAELNAGIGKIADDQAFAAWNAVYGWTSRAAWDSNWKWTPRGRLLDDVFLKSLDPFFLAVKVPFKTGSTGHTLELTYQHAANWTGYVETLYDSSNDATRAVPSMYDLSSEAALKGTRPVGDHWRNLLYSNKHDVAVGTNLLTMTGGGSEASFDAYTKIAGEGARWRCVRKHGQALQDDSMFFISHNDGSKRGISFRVLWLNWKDVFGKAYDIPDGDVESAIRAALAKPRQSPVSRGSFARNDVKVVAPAAKDYNLETGLPGA